MSFDRIGMADKIIKTEIQSKKRKRRDKLCHEFQRTGMCKFADTCKFAHGESELKKRSRKPTLSEERQSLRAEAAERDLKLIEVVPFANAGFSNLHGDFVKRYFREYFYVPENSKIREDQYVNVHVNGLCVVGLAPFHPIVIGDRKIKSVIYKYDLKGLGGKKKKSAPKLAPDSIFCTITCEDATVWQIRAGIQGSLWEINTRTTSNPSLISTCARTDGYLGIIMPRNKKFHEDHFRSASLLTKTEYEILRERETRDENRNECTE